MPRVVALLLAAVVCFSSLSSARAEVTPAQTTDARDQAARVLFDAGAVAYEAGRYREALEDFERAYALAGHSELLYNIALAHDRLREDEAALAAFTEYLVRIPEEGQRRAEVESRIAVLERTIAARQSLERRAHVSHDETTTRRRRARRGALWASVGVAALALVVTPIVMTRDRSEALTRDDFGGLTVRIGGAR